MTIAPCPVCGQLPKLHRIQTGFALSCTGERHYVGVDDEGKHSVSLHRCLSEEEAKAAWNRFFGKAPQ